MLVNIAKTQTLDENLADQFYLNGELDKAITLYKRIYDKDQKSLKNYDVLLKCYLEAKNYKEGKDLNKTAQKKIGKTHRILVDYAYLLEMEGNLKEAEKVYSDLITKTYKNAEQVDFLAIALKNRSKDDYLIDLYEKAREESYNTEIYYSELSELYLNKKDFDKFLNLQFTILESNGYELFEEIKSQLSILIENKEFSALLKKEIQKKLQKEPNSNAYKELMYWYYLQIQDYEKVFKQALSFEDVKSYNFGFKLFEVGEITRKLKIYEIAEKCYSLIIKNGNSSPYYVNAKKALLQLYYDRASGETVEDSALKVEILNKFISYIKENEYNYDVKAEMSLMLADIYLNLFSDIQSSKEILVKNVDISNVVKPYQAKGKLKLGDIYVMEDNTWEATLFYSQVEKMYKNHPLGHEAKFKNAKLSFFRGEFDWAKAQLDVLKGSTSQLIANDALQLGLLIQDNTGLDSNKVPLQMFANADFLYAQKKYDEALKLLDTLTRNYLFHSIIDEVYYLKANIYKSLNDKENTIKYYKKVYDEHGSDILGDDALFFLADYYASVLKDYSNALEYYQKILIEYPGSVFTVLSSEKYKILRGTNPIN
jgi:tetratricopeptide (TPR) repeat protein